MDDKPGGSDDPGLDAYFDALRRELIEPPSELTERRHLRAIATATSRARRRILSHGVGRVAALALISVLIALNGSALADALPSVQDVTAGLGRAVHVVFDRSSAETGWAYERSVVTPQEQVEDPEVRTGVPQPEQPASAPAPEAPTPTPAAPRESDTPPLPEAARAGEDCATVVESSDEVGRRDKWRCGRDRVGDDQDRRRRSDDATTRDDRHDRDPTGDRDHRRRDDGDHRADRDGSRWSDRDGERQGGNR